MKSQLNIFYFIITAFYSLSKKIHSSHLKKKNILLSPSPQWLTSARMTPLAPSSKALLCRNGQQTDAFLLILQKFKNMNRCRRGHQILTIKAGAVFLSLTPMLSSFLSLTTNPCIGILILKMSLIILFSVQEHLHPNSFRPVGLPLLMWKLGCE